MKLDLPTSPGNDAGVSRTQTRQEASGEGAAGSAALCSCVPLLCTSGVDTTDSGLSSWGVRTISINKAEIVHF